MKALITGGYGFIGSHVADRFLKEGYEVFIIDNLSSGTIDNISFKHKGYQLSVDDPKCEEIFRSTHFDVVIHMAAQVSVFESVRNPGQDAKSNILGLLNMLTLAQKYRVKRFIFASSEAVFGNRNGLLTEDDPCEPDSPFGISKWIGEYYCQKWNALYDLETMCFRLSNVYGPRQKPLGEGGVMATFMNQFFENRSLDIPGDGNQVGDFIYVEDVADAIFRASYTKLCGIYNLSSNQPVSINAITEIFKDWDISTRIIYSESREDDRNYSLLSNEKIKNELDWSPLYTVRKGLRRTYAWWRDNNSAEQKNSPKTKVKNSKYLSLYTKVRPYVENLLVFAIISWLILTNHMSMYQSMNLGMFYITVIGIMYGNRQALLAVVLAICLLVAERLSEGREFLSLFYDTAFFFEVAIYLFVGLVVGYSFKRKKVVMNEQKARITELESHAHFLNDMYKEVREVKDELQNRILNSEDSFGKIHSVLKELEGLEPEKVISSTVSVVQKIMNAKNVSIFMLSKNQLYFRRIAQSQDLGASGINSLRVEESAFVQSILRDGKIFVNRNLDRSAPMMATPIYHHNKIVALITIDGMSFENFTLHHENLFSMTTEMISSALSRAFTFIEANKMNRYLPHTQILYKEVFQEIVSIKKRIRDKHHTPFLLLEGNVNSGQSLTDYSLKLSALLRENDYMGRFTNEKVVILLSNTTEMNCKKIIERFEKNGIRMKKFEGVI